MAVIELDDYSRVPVRERRELAKNLKATAIGHTFKYESVVGNKTYVFDNEDMAKRILQYEKRGPRTLEQIHAEAKPGAHPRLSKLAQEQIATPPQVKEPIYHTGGAMKDIFEDAQEAEKEGLESFTKNIADRRKGLVHQDKDYLKKNGANE